MTIKIRDENRINDTGFLPTLEPDDVLYEAETPGLFTVHTREGLPLLAYLADESEDGSYYVLAPCGQGTLSDLRTGRLPVRDALIGPYMKLAFLHKDGAPIHLWKLNMTDLTDEHLPMPGATLLPPMGESEILVREASRTAEYGGIRSQYIEELRRMLAPPGNGLTPTAAVSIQA